MFRNSKCVKIGNVEIGNGNDILIQSMTNTKTKDIKSTILQIKELENAGCEIVRVTVPDLETAECIKEIKNSINIPLVADIHFDYKIALKVLENGIDKLRINPGNIGDESRVKQLAYKAKDLNIPIRIGVNSGSLEKSILKKYGHPSSDAMVESALYHIDLLNKYDFDNIVISLKSSNIKTMYEAYKKISKIKNYPLRLGVTEAGTKFQGTVKSSIGIGSLLLEGIGDTIRVSLTENPVEEIKVGKEILKVLGLRNFGVEIISCPTCGRAEIDIIGLANEVEQGLKHIKKPLKIAVMGCIVNGPGEAKEADFGVAGGREIGVIFKKGEIVKKVPENEIVDTLIKLVNE